MRMAVHILLQCLVLLAFVGCCSCAGSAKSHGAPQNLEIHPSGNVTDGEEEETDHHEGEKGDDTEDHDETDVDEHLGSNDTARHPAAEHCWNGRGFTTVENCLKMCNDPEAVDETSSGGIKVVALELTKSSFSFDRSTNKLTVNELKQREFDHSQFNLAADKQSALVCMDVSDKFKGCQLWELDPEEFDELKNFSIQVKSHNEVHDFGSYFITNDGSAWVCQNKDAQNNEEVTTIKKYTGSTATEKHTGSGAVTLYAQFTVTIIILWEMLAITLPFL